MEIQIFTPNLDILIQDSIMLIEYCYYGIVQIVSSINL
jgi:hypothetical protein